MKRIYVLRGLPGSGKSTLSCKLAGHDGIVLSANNYFMSNGEYLFNPKHINLAHQDCMRKFIFAIDNDEQTIVVDNTNLSKWEASPYFLVGETFGYEVTMVVMKESDPQICANRTRHGVPLDTIKRMARFSEDPLPWWNVISCRKDGIIAP